ncbi:MAG: response regulator [Candidatus Omnitrophica bacterium]|nr:response regulator [Candidatus Omnitrophota bacterium]
MKILIIDDSLMDRKLISNIIKRSGVANDFLEASNGEEGLKLLSDHFQSICLILLDWQMPVMDGIEFMKGVVNVPEVNDIPIVMITASGSEENKRLARETNPNLAGYVVKPYKPDILINTIKPFIR